MAYRNKTFVSFASEDITHYRLMTAWKAHDHIDFNFYDAHDLNTARDTSQPETIRRRLSERLANTKQVIMLIGDDTRKKAADSSTFVYHEVQVISSLNLPVVFANLNKSRTVEQHRIPTELSGPYSISVSFQAKIIQYALDNFVTSFQENESESGSKKTGPHHYVASVYTGLGL